jgi:hypothetical protein
MVISQNHNDLFRQSTTAEKLAMFQSMLDSHDIQPEEALALLGSIHAELRQPQEGAVYAQYAKTMASLLHEMPAVHEHVAANWQIQSTRSQTSDYDELVEGQDVISGLKHGTSASEPARETESTEGVEGGEEESGESAENEEKVEKEEKEEEPQDESESQEEKVEDESEAEEKEENGREEEISEEESEVEEENEETEEVDDEAEQEAEEPAEVEDEPEAEEADGEIYEESVETGNGEAEDDEVMATEAAEADEHMSETEFDYEPIEGEEMDLNDGPLAGAGE